jgi:hypothetical protein
MRLKGHQSQSGNYFRKFAERYLDVFIILNGKKLKATEEWCTEQENRDYYHLLCLQDIIIL